jgi:hypothetical protein
MTSSLPVPSGNADPRLHAMLKLIADLNAQSRASRGTSFGVAIDGQGNAYWQDSASADTQAP